MKLLDLKISAFGSYAGEVALELSRLDGRLYLITGPTGAGKTTIFDAICFALYGDPSGSARDAGMLRSMYADLKTPTYVELTFSCHGDIYIVNRNPSYERAAKRGSGSARENASATLKLPDGRVITKEAEVNEAIISLLGIGRDQFVQIAMIAQGDFQRSLLATTKERSEIFRKIFGTSAYARLQDELKALSAEQRRACDELRRQLEGSLAALALTGDFPEPKEQFAQELIDLAARQQQLDSAELMTVKTRTELLEQQLISLAGERSKLEQRASIIKELAGANSALDSLRAAHRRLEEEHKKLRNAAPEREKALREAGRLEGLLPSYRRVTECAGEQLADRTALDNSRKKLEKEAAKLSETEKELEKTRKRLGELSGSEQKLQLCEGRAAELSKTESNLKELRDWIVGLEGILKQLSEKQAEYKRHLAEKENADRYLSGCERAFLDAQAGILAGRLTDGAPCPVCGSTVHPSPCRVAPGTVTEEQYKAAKKDAEKIRLECERASAEAGKLSARAQSGREMIESRAVKELGEASGDTADAVKRRMSGIAAAKDELGRQSEQLKNDILLKQKLEKDIPLLEAGRNTLTDSQKALSNDISRLSAAIESRAAELEHLRSGLSYKDEQEAKTALEKLRTFVKKYDADLESAGKALADNAAAIASCESRAETLTKSLSELPDGDLGKTADEMEKIGREKQSLTEKRDLLNLRLTQNQKQSAAAERLSARLAGQTARYRSIKALSDTANGDLTGADKLTLETFIQTEYLDRVLLRTNSRLLTMSGGKYELCRRAEADNRRSLTGLELDVIDHSGGKPRSVKSLSGGESFLASLSLALGLSDEIQSQAGGVELDCMFIDEGFGTLDSDTLEQAMRVLSTLSDGSRTVGVISHVKELNDRIDTKIIVSKSPDGTSRARLEI